MTPFQRMYAIGRASHAQILHEWSVVTHHDDDGIFGDAESVDLGHDLADPLIHLHDTLGDGAAIQRPELGHVGTHEGEREQRPVVEEEGLVLRG